MIDKNWNRWIFASASVAFKGKLTELNPAQEFIVEGENKKLETNYIELRMNGPTWYQASKKHYYGDVIINLLVRSSHDEKDFHKIFRMVGLAEGIFLPCFPIKKYGNTPDDNENIVIGNLVLQTTGDRSLETNHYGQLSPDLPMFESTVEGLYRADLTLP